MHRLISLLIGLFFLSSAFADNRTTLHDFRFWSSPERTRIVIDVDQGVRFSINQQQNQFTLGIRNAKLLKDTYKKLFFTDQRIKKRVSSATTPPTNSNLNCMANIKSKAIRSNQMINIATTAWL